MERFYDALNTGDLAFIESVISDDDDVRGIGTDPDEWWRGRQLAEVWKEQIEAMGGSMPLNRSGDLEAYEEGAIGWVADRPTMQGPDGSELGIRFTAVFHQEDGAWKMVQSHGSFGVGNEDTFGDLPT